MLTTSLYHEVVEKKWIMRQESQVLALAPPVSVVLTGQFISLDLRKVEDRDQITSKVLSISNVLKVFMWPSTPVGLLFKD